MITTVTSVTTLANGAMAYGFGILATLMLIGFLIAKELCGAAASSSGPDRRLSLAGSLDRALNVVIIPFLVVFTAIVIDKVVKILR
jgi:hypothetical protein